MDTSDSNGENQNGSQGSVQQVVGGTANSIISEDFEMGGIEVPTRPAIAPNNHSLPPEHKSTLDKRRAIRAIMADRSLSERERSFRIQQMMDNSSPTAILTQLQQEQHDELQQAAANGEISQNNVQALQVAVATGTAIPCVHYERKCNIIAPCCGKIYGCRVCHDELTNGSHGPMDRFKIREIVCKECNVRQPCSNQCINCGIKFAEYHCDHCNLWMELKNKPFHCDKCGFCRVGGRDKFRHCDQCAMCINIDTFESHNCLKDKYKNNCPVCREDMHTSRHAPQDLPCGHAIHAHCFRKLAGFDYRCPICKKTVVSQKSMAAAWAERKSDIESQPMPEDLSRSVDIMCNDCEQKSPNLPWHFLGVQCPKCCSFNTVVEVER